MPQNVTIVGTITIGEETKMCSISGVGAIAPVDPGYGIPNVPRPPVDPGLHPEHPIYLPPGIWPSPGHPAHPIAPGGPPPGIWPGPGYPAHPIVLPDPPDTTPPIDPPTNPSNPSWVWGYVPGMGWRPVYVPGPGEPGPKK